MLAARFVRLTGKNYSPASSPTPHYTRSPMPLANRLAKCTRPIDVVEAGYRLDLDLEGWLHGIVRAAGPDLDVGNGVMAFVSRLEENSLPIVSPIACNRPLPPEATHAILAANAAPPKPVVEYTKNHLVIFASVSETFDDGIKRHLRKSVASDTIAAMAQDGNERVLQLIARADQFQAIHPRTAAAWRRVLLHLGTALRLRERLQEPEAVLTANGRVCDAHGAAASKTAREVLAEAVRRVERSRSRKIRRDPSAALELWQGLVAGRWSLIDHFDANGRRYLAAHENLPGARDPRALSPLEHGTLRSFLRGASPAEIAFAFGKSRRTIGTILSSLAKRLGFPSRTGLARLREAEALERLDLTLGGSKIGVVAISALEVHPTWKQRLPPQLLAVAQLAAEGTSDEEIARRRGRSVRTVSNQLGRAFKLMGIGSRAELASAFHQPARR